jgi:hypothetical protein
VEVTVPKIVSDPASPLCYRCHFRSKIDGDRHSRCSHPIVLEAMNSIASLGSVSVDPELTQRTLGVGGKTVSVQLNSRGIEGGWAHWPHNFDPVWLEWCTGAEKIADGEMRLFVTTGFDGHWVGTAAVIVARSEEEAEELLAEQLREDHELQLKWGDDEVRLTEVPLTHPKAIVLQDGDY